MNESPERWPRCFKTSVTRDQGYEVQNYYAHLAHRNHHQPFGISLGTRHHWWLSLSQRRENRILSHKKCRSLVVTSAGGARTLWHWPQPSAQQKTNLLAPQTSLSGHYVAELRSPSGSFSQTLHIRLIEKGRTSNASAAPH